MDQGDQKFFEDLKASIEQTLETWMENHVKLPVEGTVTRNLTDFNKTVMNLERRHRKRWCWIMAGFIVSIITNIILVTVVLW